MLVCAGEVGRWFSVSLIKSIQSSGIAWILYLLVLESSSIIFAQKWEDTNIIKTHFGMGVRTRRYVCTRRYRRNAGLEDANERGLGRWELSVPSAHAASYPVLPAQRALCRWHELRLTFPSNAVAPQGFTDVLNRTNGVISVANGPHTCKTMSAKCPWEKQLFPTKTGCVFCSRPHGRWGIETAFWTCFFITPFMNLGLFGFVQHKFNNITFSKLKRKYAWSRHCTIKKVNKTFYDWFFSTPTSTNLSKSGF